MKRLHKSLLTNLLVCCPLMAAPPFVTTTPSKELAYYPKYSAPAKVVALNHSVIPAELSANIVDIKVRVGDRVDKGQTLALLDCRDSTFAHSQRQAQLEQTQNNLQFNLRELQRAEKLAKQRNLGEAELDRRTIQAENSESQKQSQQAALQQAELNLSRCQITAPFEGVVTQRQANVGERVNPGQAVIRLLQSNQEEISARIALSDETSFQQANQYWLTSNDTDYPLTLRHFLPVIENGTQSREARFTFQAPSSSEQKAAYVGSTGRVFWQSSAPFLPSQFLQQRNGKNGIFVFKGGVAFFQEIEESEEGRPIPIHNLAEDTQIIFSGYHGLTDGQPVMVVPNKKQGE
ncbi:efflux RND transporter periplasmic adaptor subunit [Pleionea sp. CnH1-48]|uniref:efflux RND transporter periplasmic adaptor subunit n=1 Tax=Pleionea sp. CnH1-48 TaxID=2954494 RepID=UPI002097B6D0|nr:efflux RND transporter periplasmic adaptor subunit [Pleionea sp. CnH1-48]MCO7223563.1 efflux RND transporter periplasmic adaptor subunit [Pleionea sp. CnH1-48]